MPAKDAKAHRRFAVECFNATWTLIEKRRHGREVSSG